MKGIQSNYKSQQQRSPRNSPFFAHQPSQLNKQQQYHNNLSVGNTNQPLHPQEDANPTHPSIASDPSLFTVGTMVDVQMMDGPPVHGIIKWMGTLPNYEGYFAGIELVCYIIEIFVLFLLVVLGRSTSKMY